MRKLRKFANASLLALALTAILSSGLTNKLNPLQYFSQRTTASQMLEEKRQIISVAENEHILGKEIETKEAVVGVAENEYGIFSNKARECFNQKRECFGELLREYPESVFIWNVRETENLWRKEEMVAGFKKATKRIAPYLASFKRTFRENLPEEFENYSSLLPLAESEGRNIKSDKGAAGMFQLWPPTARVHGADVDFHDERWNPVISANLAAKVLSSDFDRLKDIRLTLAAYNSSFVSDFKRKKHLYGDGKLTFENYLIFLGELWKNPEKRKYISENFGFVSRIFAFDSLGRSIAPELFREAPSEDFEVRSIRRNYIVKRGDNLWNVAKNYLESYGAEPTNPEVRRFVSYLQKGVDENIQEGDEIVIGLPTLDYLGRQKARIMQHNPHFDLSKPLKERTRIVIPKYS